MRDGENRLKQIEQDIKKELSEKRYRHSIGVMKRAGELAEKYAEDIEKAMLTGLAHDIAKEMSKEEILEYIEKYQILVDEYEERNLGLLHGKIGAHMCKQKYGFTEEMQKAIEYHTTANPKMDRLAKIIYIADKTEEGRKYMDSETIKQKEAEGLDSLLLYELDNSIIYMIEKGSSMHPDTVFTRNVLLSK